MLSLNATVEQPVSRKTDNNNTAAIFLLTTGTLLFVFYAVVKDTALIIAEKICVIHLFSRSDFFAQGTGSILLDNSRVRLYN
jgi:hypothetical protein